MAWRTSTAQAVAAAAAVNSVGLLPLYLTTAMAVQLRGSFGITPTELGIAATTFLASAAAGSAVLGALAQRIGSSPAMRIGSVASALCAVGIAWTAQHMGVLIAWLVLGGLALSLSESSSNLSLSERVVPGQLATAFGVKQAALAFSPLLAGLAVPAIALTFGWRWAYVAAAGLALAAIPLIPQAVRPPMGKPGAQRRFRVSPLLLGIAVTAACGFAGAMALITHFVDASVTAGTSEARAGLDLALGGLAAGIARILFGIAVDRTSWRHLQVVAALIAAGAAGLLLLAHAGPAVRPLAILVAFGLGWSWTGIFFFSIAHHYAGAVGSATGVVLTGSFVGSLLGPTLFGVVADRAGHGVAWTATAGLMLAGATGLVLVQRRLLPQGQ